jgi:hypothetical protein
MSARMIRHQLPISAPDGSVAQWRRRLTFCVGDMVSFSLWSECH